MDKLEKHIKKQLQNREISPSPEAWNKIKGTLEQEKAASPKKTYWWAIAAGLVGLIVLSIQFFSPQDTIKTPGETIVAQEEEKTYKKETLEIREERDADLNVERSREELVLEVPMDQQRDQESKDIENSIEVAENEVANDQDSLKDIKEVTDLDITNKLEEVLAQVNTMEDNSLTVSDEEIDSLLMAAQKELLAGNAFEENGKVDAMALLNEVELELYDDERNPLFIRLKEGFFRLRTAVADRNN